MDLTSSRIIWPLLAALVFIAVLGVHSWRRRSMPGALPFAIASFCLIPMLAGAVAEAMAIDIAAKIAWIKFQAIWQLPTVTAVTCFALEYVRPGRWLNRRSVILLALPPLLSLLLILTNNLHHWMWREFTPDGSHWPLYGLPGQILIGYGVSLILVNVAAFGWLSIRSPQHRPLVALIVLGQITARVVYVLDATNSRFGTPLAHPLVFEVLLTFGIYAIALYGYGIFNPLPAAQWTVIQQMRDGMAVFDAQWQAVSLNPAAEKILGASATQARGKTLQELLPELPDLSMHLTEVSDESLEISRGTDSTTRHYALALSPLHDFRGLLVGRVLLLRDATEQKRTQAQILEHQWAQATLQEREQLAHELHDGLSQNLAFINLQAQAVQLFIQAGQQEAARTSLTTLAEASRELQDYMREIISDLLAVSLPSEGFCPTLRQIVTRFETQNRLAVRLDIAGDAKAFCSPPLLTSAAGVQLIRIVQEALANVRKHAGRPNQISVQLKAEAGQMQLIITDNGAGFDPNLPANEGKHFGLQVMRQRAARIGGQIAVHSAPGQGTRVEVSVPLNTLNSHI